MPGLRRPGGHPRALRVQAQERRSGQHGLPALQAEIISLLQNSVAEHVGCCGTEKPLGACSGDDHRRSADQHVGCDSKHQTAATSP